MKVATDSGMKGMARTLPKDWNNESPQGMGKGGKVVGEYKQSNPQLDSYDINVDKLIVVQCPYCKYKQKVNNSSWVKNWYCIYCRNIIER